ncbi:aldose epimerase family protein [Marinigracilibium pacificum]|uniref:Aldose 1-epimerase n=1 Tax=Marinigracilibium pacificum TaxID=2729599 RepID=A0A848IYE9_9BACT|nr:hypothetical protein [Marinigracilibium pacificum]NMM48351.1 hypothetical protein [Marinigracilibium pacificum]
MKALRGLILLTIFSCSADKEKHEITISNEKIVITQSLQNSAITELRLKDDSLNVYSWSLPMDRMPETHTVPFKGHFIALGNWGFPTENEQKSGQVFYGEVNTKNWELLTAENKTDSTLSAEVHFKSDISKLDVSREITLFKTKNYIKISEKITNTLPVIRPFQLLQHPTLGTPFISEKTIVNSNAGIGFFNNGPFKKDTFPPVQTYSWPVAILPTGSSNLKHTDKTFGKYLSSHIFPDSVKNGWVTAYNPEFDLLIGYFFSTDDYPWINFWQSINGSDLEARAFEFSNVGISEPLNELILKDLRFNDVNSFEIIDAESSIKKEYYVFLIKVPEDFSETTTIKKHSKGFSLRYESQSGKIKELNF